MREVFRAIIIHGEKQNPDGSLHPEYIDRMRTALALVHEVTVIVLTGGKTRQEFQSEASQARDWLVGELKERKWRMPEILIEEESKTTAENILCAQRVLMEAGIVPKEVCVLTRISAGPKTKYLYGKLWQFGAPVIHFFPCLDTKSLWYRLADITILYLVAIIDPRDRWVLKLPKMMFRND